MIKLVCYKVFELVKCSFLLINSWWCIHSHYNFS